MEVIAAFEDTPQGRDALGLARMLADIEDAGLGVAVVYELDPLLLRVGEYPAASDGFFETAFAAARDACEASFEELRVTAISPQEGLQRVARERGARVLVVGPSHRGRAGRLLIGSAGEGVLSAAPCAVAVAPRSYEPPRGGRPLQIGVAWDGRAESRHALAHAVELAKRSERATLRITTVVPTFTDFAGETHVFDELREKYEAVVAAVPALVPHDVTYSTELIEQRADSFADELATQALGLDLLVVGSRSFGPIRRALVGSTSRSLFRSAPCPLMVVPRPSGVAEEFIGPSPERMVAESVPAA